MASRVLTHWLLLMLCMATAGCSVVGPAAVRNDRFNYNQAGAESTKEQLLLNIVRLRYGAPIYVMEIGSMVGSHTLTANASYGAWWNDQNVLGPALRAIYGIDSYATRQENFGTNFGYTDSPTITYTPVTGEEFADRMMTPIPNLTIIQLCESGWRMDQLLECCVQWVNGIPNAPVTSDADSNVDISRFERMAELMRSLQKGNMLVFSMEKRADDQSAVYLHTDPAIKGMEQERLELRELLGYTGGPVKTLKLVPEPFKRSPEELAIKTRSLLGVMSSLSQTIDVPEEHEDRGWTVHCCREEHGEETKWMNVHCSVLPRGDAFVQVFYKGHWFYIDEKDRPSKQTFALLDYLFSLQQSARVQNQPIVTVPAK